MWRASRTFPVGRATACQRLVLHECKSRQAEESVWEVAKIDLHIPFRFPLLLKQLKLNASTKNTTCGNRGCHTDSEACATYTDIVFRSLAMHNFGSVSFCTCSGVTTGATSRSTSPSCVTSITASSVT